MARFQSRTIEPGMTGDQIWERIKLILQTNPSVEIRQAAPGSQALVRIIWLDEHCKLSDHEEA